MVVSLASLRCGCALTAALLLLTGCHRGSPTAPRGQAHALPAAFWLYGSADSQQGDGTTVSCVLELRFELSADPRVTPQGLVYEGVHGGSIRRTVLDARGNGISLWPHVHGAVVVRSLSTGAVEILIPANVGADGRFWRELARIEGRFDASGRVNGNWRCAPFDIDEGGYVDRSHTAPGTWSLEPDL